MYYLFRTTFNAFTEYYCFRNLFQRLGYEKNSNYFTYNHFIGYTKPKNTQQGTAATYVIYVSLEVEENPQKERRILLGEET